MVTNPVSSRRTRGIGVGKLRIFGDRLRPLAGVFRDQGEPGRGSGYATPPPSQYAMAHRGLQVLSLITWTVGVPVLATGLYLNRPIVVSAGAGLLLAGTLAGTVNTVRALRYVRPPAGPPTETGSPRPPISRPTGIS